MVTLLKANLKEATGSLFATRQRSLLALLGIAIGIGSVIAMISVGMIVRDEALKHFRELGTDILNIHLRQSGATAGRPLLLRRSPWVSRHSPPSPLPHPTPPPTER